MVFNISFIDHVISVLGGRLFWNVFVRKDFCIPG